MSRLRWSDEVLPVARAVLAAERDRLRAAGVPGDLRLVGGSSVAGALTRGDVDLHLRVPPADFAVAVATLRGLHDAVHPEIWGPTLATFAVRSDVPVVVVRTPPRAEHGSEQAEQVRPGTLAAPPVGLAATPLGSEHDLRFTRTWTLLAADADLLAEHNALKREAVARGDAEYERRKSAFFDRVVATWGTHPAGGARAP